LAKLLIFAFIGWCLGLLLLGDKNDDRLLFFFEVYVLEHARFWRSATENDFQLFLVVISPEETWKPQIFKISLFEMAPRPMM